MRREKLYKTYCSGCGLCKNAVDVQFGEKKGFEYPLHLNNLQLEFCERVCPVNGKAYNESLKDELWGAREGIYSGWAMQQDIRFSGASGGVITALCIFLLETSKCDAILQIGEQKGKPFGVELYSNTEVSAVKACSTSRYITCLTYQDLEEKIEQGKKYAVVGKPCDIEALSNYMLFNDKLRESIIYRLTFFCAGAPSVDASVRLAEELGIKKQNVVRIRYRGNGWPGKTTVLSKDYEKNMGYIESWNKIFGRDIRKMCKFCINGTGRFADISCGELWNLNQNNRPVFDEAEGKNIIFARTKLGDNILQEACSLGYIHIEDYDTIEKLRYIQPNHYAMQTTMSGKIVGLKLCGEEHPKYNINKLMQLSKEISVKKIIRTTLGTIKRVIKRTL